MERDTLEYVALRVIRRFFFREASLHALGRFLPHYRVNTGLTDPWAIAEAYASDLARVGVSVAGQRILEIGSGAANGVGYALAALGAAKVVCHEPFVPFDVGLDAKHLGGLVPRFPTVRFSVVDRVRTLAGLPDGSIDLVVSNSVLEHVADPGALFADLGRLLAPGGVMLHRVDYRDHFFKYPFHFLLFSKFAWKWFLNPGDLPRWRLDDHLAALAAAGFDASVLEADSDPEAFAAIAGRLHPDFQDRDPAMLAVTRAVIYASGGRGFAPDPTGGNDSPRTPPAG
ncbi:Methyltransferase type 12 [Solidesulfovibrio carbinoliphilus subsp. oakridgensis]|uniref:Methyltransferase type 12 n=1 Tax=Solidesulfovibrio carbinoliphilus subsp. oakridgensis TaxID=694327 RepID=G7Q890_9BACT|nr:class I SAM-dependent methyltransferase [Solidesulfovibrio carbinoliphilus]EHJ48104.1 Methyltransferase type 12 [Solidesulfovibrio carbinoliphilus subsp. oakridgensis]